MRWFWPKPDFAVWDLEQHITWVFPRSWMLPAVGQGALGIEDPWTTKRRAAALAPLNHADTGRRSWPSAACCMRCRPVVWRRWVLGAALTTGCCVWTASVLSPDGTSDWPYP
jgi:hypothetical protein